MSSRPLDAAWAAAEAALPKVPGWKLELIWHPLADDAAVRYEARYERSIYQWDNKPTSYTGRGPTPAAALLALVAALQDAA